MSERSLRMSIPQGPARAIDPLIVRPRCTRGPWSESPSRSHLFTHSSIDFCRRSPKRSSNPTQASGPEHSSSSSASSPVSPSPTNQPNTQSPAYVNWLAWLLPAPSHIRVKVLRPAVCAIHSARALTPCNHRPHSPRCRPSRSADPATPSAADCPTRPRPRPQSRSRSSAHWPMCSRAPARRSA